MHIGHLVAIAALALVIGGGCGSGASSSIVTEAVKPRLKALPDPWNLLCIDSSESESALLWNGQMGLRIGRDGTGLDSSGAALNLFQIDQYEPTGEEKILPFPNPLAMTMSAGDDHVPLDPRKGTEYRQALDMRTGILQTSWKQEFKDVTLSIFSSTVLDPSSKTIGQRWNFTSTGRIRIDQHLLPFGLRIGLADSWRGGTALGPGGSFLTNEGNSQGFTAIVDEKSSGQSDWALNIVPEHAKSQPRILTVDEMMVSSKAVWAKRWQTDIEIDGPVEDQQAVRSFLFYLRSAIAKDGQMSISPFGLSNAQYNGHVFWDADIWVFPALALVDPSEASAIPAYRYRMLAMAQQNFKNWVKKAHPERFTSSRLYLDPMHQPYGAKYPWESSVTGRETVPGPSQLEDHISGGVAWSAMMARSLDLEDSAGSSKIIDEVGGFFKSRSEHGPLGTTIKNVMSPDENHIGDSDLYTNILAQWTENRGVEWNSQSGRYYLPQDKTSFLTYDGDKGKGYKQAAAVLSIYPLQYPPAERQSKVMMDRFADKVIKNGPAMSDSVHSVIWSRIGDQARAYAAWKDSWQAFTTGPLMLFSEKRSKVSSYFTTGAAGSLQAVLYGFLGFRLDYEKEPGAVWSELLNGSRWLSIKPNLPKSWNSVKFKNFTVLGRRLSLTVTQKTAHVSPGE